MLPAAGQCRMMMMSGTTANPGTQHAHDFWPCGAFNSARSTSILRRCGRDIASTPPKANPARQSSRRRKNEHDQQDGAHHLRRTQTEYHALHGAQPRQAEFKPDAEHQEHHAEFGQMAGLRRIGYPASAFGLSQCDNEIARSPQAQDAAQHHHAYAAASKLTAGVTSWSCVCFKQQSLSYPDNASTRPSFQNFTAQIPLHISHTAIIPAMNKAISAAHAHSIWRAKCSASKPPQYRRSATHRRIFPARARHHLSCEGG